MPDADHDAVAEVAAVAAVNGGVDEAVADVELALLVVPAVELDAVAEAMVGGEIVLA